MPDTPRVLVAFASTHGQSARIAERIAATLREQGLEAESHDLSKLPSGPSPEQFGAVVIGASIYAGHHQDEAVAFARDHRDALDSRPSAFFSVSLTAADEGDEALTATQKYLDDFLAKTGWRPTLSESFAGSILYSHYGIFERTLMRLIMRHMGHGDIKADHEFTDWDAVDRFALEVAAAARESAAGGATA